MSVMCSGVTHGQLRYTSSIVRMPNVSYVFWGNTRTGALYQLQCEDAKWQLCVLGHHKDRCVIPAPL